MLNRYRTRITDELSSTDGLRETTVDDQNPVQLDRQTSGRLMRIDAMQRQAKAADTQLRRQLRRRQFQQALRRMDEGEF